MGREGGGRAEGGAGEPSEGVPGAVLAVAVPVVVLAEGRRNCSRVPPV